ncbi:MAG: GNAT family N-acetyltransferase [Sedimenticola sp.]
MSNSSFSIRQAFWNHDQAALREVRSQVFIREQQVPKALEWDGLDPAAVHILAIDNDHNPIATGRLLPSGQIGRMAVMAEWRNRGVGSAVLRHLLKLSSSLEAPALFLNAQATAIKFYQRHGFHIVGPQFMEAGIIHYRMEVEA